MSRINKIKTKLKLGIVIKLLKIFFGIEKRLLKVKNINFPKGQALLSIWHGEQCVINSFKDSIEDKTKFYVLVSASNDGEMITKAIECLDLQAIRGSSKRRAVAGSLEIIDKLKEGCSIAMMVDGPRGPKGKVKDGIVNMAKLSGVPVVPVAWTSKDKTFVQFNSWDKFRLPVGICKSVALYGNPIYIPNDLTKEELKEWSNKIEIEMNKLQDDLKNNYDNYLRQ